MTLKGRFLPNLTFLLEEKINMLKKKKRRKKRRKKKKKKKERKKKTQPTGPLILQSRFNPTPILIKPRDNPHSTLFQSRINNPVPIHTIKGQPCSDKTWKKVLRNPKITIYCALMCTRVRQASFRPTRLSSNRGRCFIRFCKRLAYRKVTVYVRTYVGTINNRFAG